MSHKCSDCGERPGSFMYHLGPDCLQCNKKHNGVLCYPCLNTAKEHFTPTMKGMRQLGLNTNADTSQANQTEQESASGTSPATSTVSATTVTSKTVRATAPAKVANPDKYMPQRKLIDF